MNKSSIRSFGIGLFLACAVFQMQSMLTSDEYSTTSMSEKALEKSEAELKSVKQQLAQLQLDLENARKTPNSVEKIQKQKKNGEQSANHPVAKYTLIIQSGMHSIEIGSRLEQAGIIQNKQQLVEYLNAQKLAGRIQIGVYELDSTMTLKEIASIITTN